MFDQKMLIQAILDFFKKFSDSVGSDLQFVIDDISNEDSSAVGVTWHLGMEKLVYFTFFFILFTRKIDLHRPDPFLFIPFFNVIDFEYDNRMEGKTLSF